MGPFTWSTAAQGLDFDGGWALDDQPGNAIPVAWNTANFAANGTQGALLVHHHNGEGTRAEPVLVQTDAVAPPSSADLAVALALPVSLIQPVDHGHDDGDGVERRVPPRRAASRSTSRCRAASPTSRTPGAGTYDPATGVWTVGDPRGLGRAEPSP